jgi:hypothetical protein
MKKEIPTTRPSLTEVSNNEFFTKTGVFVCPCGEVLETNLSIFDHIEAGHFDYPFINEYNVDEFRDE